MNVVSLKDAWRTSQRYKGQALLGANFNKADAVWTQMPATPQDYRIS